MTEVVAVTRGGFGIVYLFSSRQEADLHPLIQYGDAILTGPEDVTRQYSLVEMPRFLALLGDEELRVTVLAEVHPDLGLSGRDRLDRVAARAGAVWHRLLSVAVGVPSDPSEVLAVVRSDRAAMAEQQRKETTVAEEKTKPAKAPKAAAAPKPAKEAKPPKFAYDSTIKMLADKAGKAYGKDNNPKRAGSSAAERFAFLKDGMTVKKFCDAVGSETAAMADLAWGVDKGQLQVVSKA